MNINLHNIQSTVQQGLSAALEELKLSTASSVEDVKEQLGDVAFDVRCAYLSEAIDICTSSDFHKYYEHEKFDFSNCSTSSDCLHLEANEVASNAAQSLAGEEINDLCIGIAIFSAVAVEKGFKGDIDIHSSELYAWAVPSGVLSS